MTFTLILILMPALVLTLAIVDRQRHRAAGLPTLDSYAEVETDLGRDAELPAEMTSASEETGFPGPRWLGVR